MWLLCPLMRKLPSLSAWYPWNINRLLYAFASFSSTFDYPPTWPFSAFNNCTIPMWDRFNDPLSMLDSNKLELQELVFFFGLHSSFSRTSPCNGFSKCTTPIRGSGDELSLFEHNLFELKDFIFSEPFSSGWKEVVRALSTSFCCEHSIIECFPLHKTFIWVWDVPYRSVLSEHFESLHLEAFGDPFSDQYFYFSLIFEEKSRSHSASMIAFASLQIFRQYNCWAHGFRPSRKQKSLSFSNMFGMYSISAETSLHNP